MNKFLVFALFVVSLALVGCPKADKPVDEPTKANIKTEGLGQTEPAESE